MVLMNNHIILNKQMSVDSKLYQDSNKSDMIKKETFVYSYSRRYHAAVYTI